MGASMLLMGVGVIASCSQGHSRSLGLQVGAKEMSKIDLPNIQANAPLDLEGVHQVVAYAPGLYSGSAPHGEVAFKTLQRAGIKTIISVDGATPQADIAKAHGMRYVHLPIGYNGMDEAKTLEIARAVRDLPGPIFIHCHHGKHRSAAASAAAAVTLGKATPEAMEARMRVSQTAEHYKGLWKCVEVARPANDAEIDAASNAFPQVHRTTGIVRSMVDIDEIYDHIKAIEKAGWTTPQDHPDLVPAAEAGRLSDLFRNLNDDASTHAKQPEYRIWMREASDQSQVIEDMLVDIPARRVPSPAQQAELSSNWAKVAASCKQCHTAYRDF